MGFACGCRPTQRLLRNACSSPTSRPGEICPPFGAAAPSVPGYIERADADAHEESTATFDHTDRGLDLEQAIAKLPHQARQVFVLYGIYGYPYQETAEMLNIAVGTSKAHYHRARRQLQTLLGESP